MKKRVTPKARRENLVVQELDGEVLIYDLNLNKAFSLNETSSLVWQLCDGNKSVSDISQTISWKLNSPANEDLIWLALEQLKKEKLLANGDEIKSDLAGMNRREAVKKIGLGTMIALPLVSSLVAPTVAQGASCVAEGGAVMVPDGTAMSATDCTSLLEAMCCTMNGLMVSSFGGGQPTMCSGIC